MARFTIIISLALAALSMLLLPTGCGGGGLKGPDAAVEDHIHLLNARDFGAAYDSLAAGAPARNSSRDRYVAEMQKFWGDSPASFRLSELSFSEVAIEGDVAEVTWSARYVTGLDSEPGDEAGGTSTVVLEDGTWKVEVLW